MRFPLEVFDAVRAAFPNDKPVGLRVSATDWVEGGWDIAQTIEFAQELKKRGVDWIDVSSGGVSPLQKIPLGPGYQVPLAQAVKEATGVTTIAVGLITEAKQAEDIVGFRQGRHGGAGARHAVRPALGLARRRRTRRRSLGAAAILALATLDAKGAVRRDHVRDAVGLFVLAASFAGFMVRDARRCRRVEPSLRAKRSNPAFAKRQRKLDCFVASLLAMTVMVSKHATPRSRGAFSPELCYQLPALSNQRARGMPGARCAR